MSIPAPANLRTLRQRRERADDWISYASWTAIGGAAAVAFFMFVIAADEPGGLAGIVPFLPTLAGQAAVGYKLRERSQWAGWGLMVMYVANAVLSSIKYGVLSGIVLKIALGYVYVRGWLATLDYEEISKKIAALSTQSAPGDAA